MCRSLISVWLRKTWELWQDWTEGGDPACRKSKFSQIFCGNSCLQGEAILIVWHHFSVFQSQVSSILPLCLRLPGEWREMTAFWIYYNQPTDTLPTHSITHCQSSVTCLTEDFEDVSVFKYEHNECDKYQGTDKFFTYSILKTVMIFSKV